MARGKGKTNGKGANGVGHNSGEPLTEEQRADLVAYFGSKIRAQRKKHAASKALADADRDGINALFSSARGELRMNRKEFEEVLAAQDMGEAEFLAAEVKRLDRLRLGGLPVGQQLDLFEKPRDTIDDKIATESAGYSAGLRGDDPDCPSKIAPILRADWEQGWSRGQAELGERMIRAANAIAAKAAKKPELSAGEDPDEEAETTLDPEVVAKKARDLKKAGWTEPTADEAALEAVH